MTVFELYKHLQELIESDMINYEAEVQIASWADGPYDGSKIVGIRTLTDYDYYTQDEHSRDRETVFIIHE